MTNNIRIDKKVHTGARNAETEAGLMRHWLLWDVFRKETGKVKKFPNGLTVKELKEVIANWAETDEYGEPTEVWIETGWCLSSAVIEVGPLNQREQSADLILISGAFETPPEAR